MATALRKKLRVISVLQVIAGILYVLSGIFSISFANSLSREDAINRLGHEIPTEFTRVFINHGTVYNWPFSKGHLVVACITFFVTLAFLFASVWHVRRLKTP